MGNLQPMHALAVLMMASLSVPTFGRQLLDASWGLGWTRAGRLLVFTERTVYDLGRRKQRSLKSEASPSEFARNYTLNGGYEISVSANGTQANGPGFLLDVATLGVLGCTLFASRAIFAECPT